MHRWHYSKKCNQIILGSHCPTTNVHLRLTKQMFRRKGIRYTDVSPIVPPNSEGRSGQMRIDHVPPDEYIVFLKQRKIFAGQSINH